MFNSTEKKILTISTYEEIRDNLLELRKNCEKRRSELSFMVKEENDRIIEIDKRIDLIEQSISDLYREQSELKGELHSSQRSGRKKKYRLKKVNKFMKVCTKLGGKLDKEYIDSNLTDSVEISIYLVDFENPQNKVESRSVVLTPEVYDATKQNFTEQMMVAKEEQTCLKAFLSQNAEEIEGIRYSLGENKQNLNSKLDEKAMQSSQRSVAKGRVRANKKLFRQNNRTLTAIEKRLKKLGQAYSSGTPVDMDYFDVKSKLR